MKRSPRQIAGLVMMGSGLLLTTGALFALVLTPPVYEATARILVKQVVSPELASPSAANLPPFDPNWVEAEIEKIQAKATLYPVIINLQLQTRWARGKNSTAILSLEEIYRALIQRIELQMGRGTTLIGIRAKSESADEATAIANTIAQVYRDQQNAAGKAPGVDRRLEVVQIIDVAERPARPSRNRNPTGPLPLILFAVGLLDILAGYFLVRPTLDPMISRQKEDDSGHSSGSHVAR